MSDLVKRLRDVYPKDSGYAAIAAEAADEIEHLRSVIAQWAHNCTGMHGSQNPCGLSAELTAVPQRGVDLTEGKS